MATTAATASRHDLGRRLGVLRLTVSGGITAVLVFLICWLGTFVPFSSPTHAYIGLFTNAPVGSVQALSGGLWWSLLFGGFFATVFAFVYNSMSGLERR